MIYKYVIKEIEGKETIFTGSISLQMPRPSEKLRVLKKLNLVTAEGENGLKLEANKDQTEYAANLYEYVESRIESVELTHKTFGEIKTVDEFLMLNDSYQLLSELGSVLLNGVQSGESLKT